MVVLLVGNRDLLDFPGMNLFFFYFLLFFLFGAALAAYRSSQARSPMRSAAEAYAQSWQAAACSNAGSST